MPSITDQTAFSNTPTASFVSQASPYEKFRLYSSITLGSSSKMGCTTCAVENVDALILGTIDHTRDRSNSAAFQISGESTPLALSESSSAVSYPSIPPLISPPQVPPIEYP